MRTSGVSETAGVGETSIVNLPGFAAKPLVLPTTPANGTVNTIVNLSGVADCTLTPGGGNTITVNAYGATGGGASANTVASYVIQAGRMSRLQFNGTTWYLLDNDAPMGPQLVSGAVYPPIGVQYSGGTFTPVANSCYYFPIWLYRSCSIYGVNFRVGTAGSGTTVRCGMYTADVTRTNPQTLIEEVDYNANSTGVQNLGFTTAVVAGPGLYFICICVQGTTMPALYGANLCGPPFQGVATTLGAWGAWMYVQTGVSGALPATASGGAWTTTVPGPLLTYNPS
jgi:hypothetical protein